MSRLRNTALALFLLAEAAASLFAAQAQTPFDTSFTSIADGFLAQRVEAMQAIQTRAQAEARSKQFRRFVLSALGGLPKVRTPLNAKLVGELDGNGFTVERLVYDSLPGFHVTANLYLPKSAGPFPAVLYTPGHYPTGKGEAWNLAGNMARNGIAVLVYDPIGEGERLQYFDAAAGKSLAGQPTGEHTEASVQIALTSDHIARYFVWDAMRGLDYLASRKDIDAHRLGAFGCSGGGTVTAYLAAIDPRVKAAGVACYITSYTALLATIGPQEAEQTIPGFIKAGYGFPDWIEAAAPMPYAVISTTEDMFPFEGARTSVAEAKRIYGLYGAAGQLQWVTGPGRHGNLGPVYAQIIGFFLKTLAHSDQTPGIVQLGAAPVAQLSCTNTGQVSSSLGGETLFTLNRARALNLRPQRPVIHTAADVAAFRSRLVLKVRAATGAQLRPGPSVPELTVTESEKRGAYTLQSVRFTSVTGEQLAGLVAVPAKAGKHPAVLLLDVLLLDDLTLDPRHADSAAREGGELDRLAREGSVVFVPQLPPGTPDREAPKTALLGQYYIASLRAELVGKTLVGLRIDDAIRCVNWLVSRPEVDASQISGWGAGAMGIVLLHTAVLDPRIRTVTVDHTLVGYHAAVNSALPRNLAQSVIPGVLGSYDLADLMIAIGPRNVLIEAPIDGEGNTMTAAAARHALGSVFAADERLRQQERVKVDAHAGAL